MLKRFRLFLGPARIRFLFGLLAVTGLTNLILNAFDGDWVIQAQTLTVLVFIIGAAIIIGTRLDPEERGRLLAIAIPSIGALVLGLLFFPQFLLPLVGAAIGWVIAGLFLFRARMPMEYQRAVKHLRKNEYAEAVKVMDGVIKDAPDDANHYRFRAEVLRLWGKLDRARRDYRRMTELEPESAVAFNGLAEVDLQASNYADALTAAQRAHELAPDEWVALYNLGMIEDRLEQSEAAIGHLQAALERKVPDARHRLLMHLYIARAHQRLGDETGAQTAVANLKKERAGLNEWQTIIESDQAATLRVVLGNDIELAQQIIEDDADLQVLTGSST